jgi:hopanoid-associated phosphorylase
MQPTTAMLPLLALSGLDFEARIAAGDGVIAVCGVGSAALAERLAQIAARGCSGIISFGTAGGLAPTLQPGDCVLADRVVGNSQHSWATDAKWLSALHALLPQAHLGAIAGVGEPITSVTAKRDLWKGTAALAVDMESHWAAQIAQRHGVPFAVCRVVVDPAQRSLPSSATVGLQADGSTAILPILRALAAHPGELPALLKLARDAGAARASLKRIRARLGLRFALPAY